MNSNLKHRFFLGAAFVGITSAGGQALAQQAGPLAQAESPAIGGAEIGAENNSAQSERGNPRTEIVVTGSRIARRDLVAQSPIVTTSVEAIENVGAATVDAALLLLPQLQPGIGGFTNRSNGAPGVGQANLNLRGLGTVRTLVLVDGRRAQPSGEDNVIDINTIPASALAGVEIITGGASATYGSDAIAGVANFKLRTRFDGLEVGGQVGISDQTDAASHQFTFIAGTPFASDRGSIVIAGEYADRAAVGYRDREFSTPTYSVSNSLPNGRLLPTASNLPSVAAVNALFAGYGFAPGTASRTDQFGVNPDNTLFISKPPGVNYKSDGDECIVTGLGSIFGYDPFCVNQLQGALKRYAFFAHGEFEVTPDITLFAQGNYARAVARGQGSHPGLSSFGVSGITVPISNPFIPDDLRQLLAGRPDPNASFQYGLRFTANGPRQFKNTTETYQILTGVNGRISGLDLNYELYYSHGKTYAEDNTVSGSSETAADLLINDPLGGATYCAGGFNIFGPNNVSPECAAFVRRDTETITQIWQDEFAANVSGSMFSLPAGEVEFALSAAHRINRVDVVPDELLQSGDVGSANIPPTTGRTEVNEGAIELLIPVLSDIPLIHSFNLSPAYRYSYYDPTGGVSSYKLNFDWTVFDGLLLRGGYQRAVRAPNIGEIYKAPGSVSSNIGTPPSGGDPCDVRSSLRNGPNAASVRSLCIAQGMPLGIVDAYNQTSGGLSAQSGGNPDLEPERAKTFTIGAVLQPRFLGETFRNLSLSVDFYDIRISGVIGTLATPLALAKCFNADGSNPNYSPSNVFCGGLLRSPNDGTVVELNENILNLGGYRTSGIDMQFDWRLDAESFGASSNLGSLTLNSTVSYLRYFRLQALPGDPYQDFGGTIQNSTSPSSVAPAFPTWKATSSATYGLGDARIGLRWRHLSSFRDRSTVTNPASTVEGTNAYNYFDLFAGLSVEDQVELRAGVNNIGDKQPPVVGGLIGTTNLGVYDAIGRSYFLGAKLRF